MGAGFELGLGAAAFLGAGFELGVGAAACLGAAAFLGIAASLCTVASLNCSVFLCSAHLSSKVWTQACDPNSGCPGGVLARAIGPCFFFVCFFLHVFFAGSVGVSISVFSAASLFFVSLFLLFPFFAGSVGLSISVFSSASLFFLSLFLLSPCRAGGLLGATHQTHITFHLYIESILDSTNEFKRSG